MTKLKETMSNVDTAWLQMDRPVNMMMIASFMAFDGPVDFERVMATVERRLLVFDRFRQKVVAPRIPFGNYTWELDPQFDIRAHVHRIGLPAPGDKTALQNLMSDIISTPLDRSRPLWQFHVVEGYQGCLLYTSGHRLYDRARFRTGLRFVRQQVAQNCPLTGVNYSLPILSLIHI